MADAAVTTAPAGQLLSLKLPENSVPSMVTWSNPLSVSNTRHATSSKLPVAAMLHASFSP